MKLANFFNQSNFEKYVAYLKSTGLSSSSIQRKLSSINTFQKFLVKKGINPPIKNPPVPMGIETPSLENGGLIKKILKKIKFPLLQKGMSQKDKGVLNYLLITSLLIIVSGIGITIYRQAITQANKNLAYTTASNPIYANRFLSFQGRLTDSSGNPITSETSILFELFNTETVGTGTTLYSSAIGNSQTVVPDDNGIFSVTIGKTHGTEIPDSVFTQNSSVYLQITAGGETMDPRQPIATVAYAINSETLQGLEPSASGLKDTVLVIDGEGNLNLGETSPTIKSTSGTLGIEAQSILLTASNGSGGDIEINPDANGIIKLTTEGSGSTAVGGFIDATNANLSTGNLFNADINNTNREYNFISFNNYDIGTTNSSTRFSVDAYGNTFIGGTLSPTTISIGNTIVTSSAYELNLLDGLAATSGSVIYANGSKLSNTDVGTSGQVLMSNGSATPTWVNSASVNPYTAGSGLTLSSSEFSLGGELTSDVNLTIGSTSALFINSTTGYVGIGTTTPTHKLDVIGDGSFSTNLSIGGTLTLPQGATDGYILTSDASGNSYWAANTGIGTTYAAGSGLTLNSEIFSLGGELTSDVNLTIGSTSALFINSTTGNIGIGTTSPSQALDVNGKIAINGQQTIYNANALGIATGSLFIGNGGSSTSSTGVYNTGIGIGALSSVSSVGANTAIGYNALTNNTSYENTAIGAQSLETNTTGHGNIAVGRNSLFSNIAGSNGVAIGYDSQRYIYGTGSTAWANYNTSIGYQALRGSTTATDNTGNSNTAIGYQSMLNNTSGIENISIGAWSLLTNSTGSNNFAIGKSALRVNTSGSSNMALGSYSLYQNETGNYNMGLGGASLNDLVSGNNNIAIGQNSLHDNISGSNGTAIGYESQKYVYGTGSTPWTNYNTSIGYQALRGSTTAADNTGNYNTAIGYQSLVHNTSGSDNSAQGVYALLNNTTGSSNSAQGYSALQSNTSGGGNSAQGQAALYFNINGNYNSAQGYAALMNSTGSLNTALGYNSGRYYNETTGNLTSANNSLFLGASSSALADGGSNEIVIGYDAIGNGSNSVTLGNDSVTKTILKGNIGIGTTNPSTSLHIETNSASGILIHRTSGNSGIHIQNDNDDVYFGINDNDNISFGYSADLSVGKLQITPTGNVGIGTTNPSYKLDVIGDGSFSTNLSIGGTLTLSQGAGSGKILQSDASGNASWVTATGIGGTDPLTAGTDISITSVGTGRTIANTSTLSSVTGRGASTSTTLHLLGGSYFGSTNQSILKNNGYVGIGTTNPDTPLEIYHVPTANDTFDDVLKVTSKYPTAAANGFGPAIVFSGSINDSQERLLGRIATNKEGATNTAGMTFSTQSTADTVTEKMRITAAGNVGIGTTSPSHKLEVVGDGIFTSTLDAATINTGNGDFEINSIAAYLGNQNLRTTDSPTFATVNTGHGANELYAMNQDVTTSNSPTFAGLTLNGNLTLGSNTLTTSNTTVVTNLNADLLDGQHSTYFLNIGQTGSLPYVNNTTNSTLTRSGSGPYTLGINLANANTWTGSQTFGRAYQYADGTPTSNLGTPSITEMALFDEEFNNKTAFYDINNIFVETSTDGTTWVDYGATDDQKRKLVGGDSNSSLVIPYGTAYFRVRFRSTSYVYLNALYSYWSTNGHSSQVQIYKQHDSGSYTQHTSSTTNVSAWPGHLYLPFNTIPFKTGGTLGTHYDEVSIVFIPTWNGTYPSNNIFLYKMQLWGGYPSAPRNLFATDEYRNVIFPANLSSTKNLTVGGTFVSVGSTNLVTNLNADLLDGLHASSFLQSADLSNYVQGPASATDNAIARYNATTGKLIQNSGVTIDDSNNLTTTGIGNFATINTGNGNYEVNSIAGYLGNQNLRTTDSSTFAGLSLNNNAADGANLNLASSGYSNWTIDNFSGNLRFYYGSAEKQRFYNNGGISIGQDYAPITAPSNGAIIEGNVGIGTTNPTEKLDVYGNVLVEGSNFVKWNNGTGTKLIGVYGSNNDWLTIGGGNTTGKIRFVDGDDLANDYAQLSTSGLTLKSGAGGSTVISLNNNGSGSFSSSLSVGTTLTVPTLNATNAQTTTVVTNLNADLLDGNDSSVINMERSGIGTNTSWDITTPGMYGVASSTEFTGTNAPTGVYRYGVLVVEKQGTYGIVQTYYPHTGTGTSKVVRRTGWNNNSGWQDWATVWASNSDGSGSGLDADLLDGLHASSFLQSADLANYVTGPASSTDNAIARYNATTGKLIQNSGVTIDDSNNLTTTGIGNFATVNTGNGNYEVNSIAGYLGNQNLRTTDSPTFAGLTLNGNLTLGANTLTTSNTGLVSNLNADMLDGYHASSFIYTAGNGLTLASNQFKLGGTLSENTDIGFSGFSLTFSDAGSTFASFSAANNTFYNPTSFTSAGDVSMAYDLNFTNSTSSTVRSYSPFYIQTESPYANLDINLTAANSGKIYLNSDTEITNNLNVGGTATFTGSVGIDNNLSVGGTATFTGPIAANGGLTQDGNTILNGTDTWLRTTGATGWYSSTYGGGWYMTDTSWIKNYNSKALYINGDGTNSAVFVNGNVGINTSSPQSKLDIQTSGYGFPVTSGSSQTYGGLRISPPSSSGNVVLDMGINSSNGAWLQVANRASLGTTYPLLLNPNGGFVGIGTSNPDSQLSLGTWNSGNAGVTDGAQLRLSGAHNTGSNIGGYKLLIEGYDNDGSIIYPIYLQDENNGVDFWIKNRPTVSGLSTAYFQGNVGIGTTNPSYKLNVVGNSYFTDNIGIGVTPSPTSGNLLSIGNYIKANNLGEIYTSSIIDTEDNTAFLDAANSSASAASLSLYATGSIRYNTSSSNTHLVTGAASRIQNFSNGLLLGVSSSTTSGASITGWDSNLFLKTNGYVGIGTTNPTNKLEVIGTGYFSSLLTAGSGIGVTGAETLQSSSSSVVHYKNLASYNYGSSITGTLKITMAKTWSNTMGVTTIKGYNYSNAGDWEVIVSGYNYGSPAWSNYSAEINGDAPFNQVRLAYDVGTSRNVILIGTTTTAWSYPKVIVTDFIAGHNSYTGWNTGWSIDVTTDESNITNSVTPTIKTYLSTSGNFGIGTTNPTHKLTIGGSSSTISNTSGDITINSYSNNISLSGDNLINVNNSYFSGNIGIGTTTPSYKLDILGTTNTDFFVDVNTAYDVRLGSRTSSASDVSLEGAGSVHIALDNDNNDTTKFFSIRTNGISTAGTELFRVQENGYVGIGTTNPLSQLHVNNNVLIGGASGGISTGAAYTAMDINYAGTTTQWGAEFLPAANNTYPIYFSNAAGSGVGSVYTTSSATTYNTTSDRRLKENIVDTSLGLETLNKLSVKDFNFINDPDKNTTQGFIAQDLYQAYPYAVTVGGDNPNINPWSVDYGRITPLIVKSVQELDTKIEILKNDLSITSTGQINVTYNISNEVLSSLGYSDTKNEIEAATYNLTDSTDKIVSRISQFSEVASAKIKAGLITTKNLIADNIVTKKLISQKVNTDELISPLGNIDHLTSRDIQSTQVTTDNLIAKNIQTTQVDTYNLNANDATISGTLYANNIVSSQGSFGDIMTNKISSLREELSRIISDQVESATQSALLTESNDWYTDIASDSATINGDLNLSDNLIIGNQLLVNGNTQLGNTFISGIFTAGQIAIQDNYIETTNTALYIQPSQTGSVHIMGETLVIADTGDVTIGGNLTVTGSFAARNIIADEINTNKLIANESVLSDISSTKLNIATDSASIIIASESDTNIATNSARINSNATAGTATLPAGKTQLIISTDKVTQNSMVYLTPLGSTQNQVLYVGSKNISETDSTQNSFTISIDNPLTNDLSVNWWIIN